MSCLKSCVPNRDSGTDLLWNKPAVERFNVSTAGDCSKDLCILRSTQTTDELACQLRLKHLPDESA
jgi:hypothetical protein